jgi:hypothetical protein
MCVICHIVGATEYGAVCIGRPLAEPLDVYAAWGVEAMIWLGWGIIAACAIGLCLSAVAHARCRRGS